MDDTRPLIAFYGDDLTGTAATAETLTQSGIPTVIFPEPPPLPDLRTAFPRARAVGVSGIARALPARRMESVLRPVFTTMREYGSPIYLYKVCSTFDSSPEVGSIGKAIEIGADIFLPGFVPVLPAAPRLGRFTVFGNHFAAMGEGDVYRLDRHPSMSRHPVTPMGEADLRMHLAAQTRLKSALIHILDVEMGLERIASRMEALVEGGFPILLFDCLSDKNLNAVCKAVFQKSMDKKPIFFVGSQELGYGFAAALKDAGYLQEKETHRCSEEGGETKGAILVLSGSCATITGHQILWAQKNGFASIPINPQNLLSSQRKNSEMAEISRRALHAITEGRSVILHTAVGPRDERIAEMKNTAGQLHRTEAEANEILSAGLGGIVRSILGKVSVRRMIITGGDTAGRIQQLLQIKALQVSKPIGIGGPLCYVYSRIPEINGLEIAFKGGQVGDIDYFHQVRCACTLPFEKAALGRIA